MTWDLWGEGGFIISVSNPTFRQILHFGKGARQIWVFANATPFFRSVKHYLFTFETQIWLYFKVFLQETSHLKEKSNCSGTRKRDFQRRFEKRHEAKKSAVLRWEITRGQSLLTSLLTPSMIANFRRHRQPSLTSDAAIAPSSSYEVNRGRKRGNREREGLCCDSEWKCRQDPRKRGGPCLDE